MKLFSMGAKKWLNKFDHNSETMVPAIYESAFGRLPSSKGKKNRFKNARR